jgi:hypothetical protein
MMHEWWFSYGYGVGPVGMLLIAGLVVWPFWRICTKAGFPGITALLILIPLVNLIFLYWLAFADWPSLHGQDRPT